MAWMRAYIMIMILLLCPGLTAQVEVQTYGNYRLYPGQVNQTEVFVVNNPADKNILLSSCNTLNFIPFFVSEGIYVSTDGGETWTGNDTCTGDPVAYHGGDPGIAIDKNGTFILTRLGRSPFTGLYSHYSTDNGKSWSSQQVISTDDLERASVATDYFPSSPYYGRTYAVWVKFAPPFPLMMSSTDDGGVNWSTPEPINNPPNRSAGGDICIGPGGEVYVSWAGVTDVSPFKEIHAGFAASDDGGNTWLIDEQAFEMNGITGLLPEKGNIRVNGLPCIAVDTSSGPYYGRIYIVTGQKDLDPAGSDPDIILNYSDDQGATWSSARRVNQDPLSNGKTQYFPAVHADRFGAVNVIYYDDRMTTTDSAGVYLSRSTDGGENWKEYEISDHNFRPEPIGGLGQGYQGDNIDLTSTLDGLIPVWMDNSSGIYQIWTADIDFSTLDDIPSHTMKEGKFSLDQNHPNPFSKSTNINYLLNEPAMIELHIYGPGGEIVFKQERSWKEAGSYHLTFEAGKPGIYLLSLRVNGSSLSKKMLCLP